jgi:hypothetical protein
LSATSLKAEYAARLVLLVLADVVAVCLFFIPGAPFGASLEEFVKSRLAVSIVVPAVVVLLVNVLNSETKAMLVYWRDYGWLPGRQAFSEHAHADVRIDPEKLRKHVGEFPTEPREQNSRWYALYKMVEEKPEVRDAHRSFLMYRDMAALSLPFIGIAPFWLYHANATPEAQWLAALLFAAQYLLTAISAKHSGVRFVRTVLALHAASKIAVGTPRKS